MIHLYAVLLVSLMAPVPSQKPSATKNRKSAVTRQAKQPKRVIKRSRGNIKNSRRRNSNARYKLQRRRKAGGTITGRNSGATNNRNIKTNKNTNKRVDKNKEISNRQTHSRSRQDISKRKERLRRWLILQWQLEVLGARQFRDNHNTP